MIGFPQRIVPFKEQILVTGASSAVGLEVVKRLCEQGEKVRAGVHSVGKTTLLRSYGADVVDLDFEHEASLARALRGVDRIFLITPFDPKMVEYTRALMIVAQQQGVKHVVKLSAQGADSRSKISPLRWHGEAESIIDETGVSWTFLRPNMFMQNFVTYMGEMIRNQHAFFAPAQDGKMAFIDARDVARVGVLALTKRIHEYKIYTLTGAQAVSYGSAAKMLSDVLGAEVAYLSVSEEQALQGMLHAKMPRWMAEAMLELYRFVRSGNFSITSPDYAIVTGEKPRLLADFIKENRASWVVEKKKR